MDGFVKFNYLAPLEAPLLKDVLFLSLIANGHVRGMAYNGKWKWSATKGAVRGTIVVAYRRCVSGRSHESQRSAFHREKKRKKKEGKEERVAGIGGTTKFREDRLHSEC